MTAGTRQAPAEINGIDAAASRLLGVYPQKQKTLYMQRINIFGGRLSWPQWRRVAELATVYTPCFPLHITTRQDVELHNINIEDILAVQQGLAEVALTTFAACGDSVRNITVCPGSDLHEGGFDLQPLARLVQQHLHGQPVIFNLPRKFKISFSGCREACARPWLSDLGFIAQSDGLFTVIGAGSLGPRPALGIELYRDLPPGDVLPLCVAAVEFFAEHGDRHNRRRARFRHVRQRLGDQAFRTQLHERLAEVRLRRPRPNLLPARAAGNMTMLHRLNLPNGNISPKQATALADAAEPEGAVLRINLEHGLELYGDRPVQLPQELAAWADNPVIIACPGCRTCPHGLADCWETAERIRTALAAKECSESRISISGCPNNCAHSAVADIGLVGTTLKDNGKTARGYRLLVGGGNGRNPGLAAKSRVLAAKHVPETVKKLLR
ncbi:MAG: nitrite/sulfite reductase [Phycisphaerales bacterium]|nr:MAG: nitrite/sulfite reductase [Phycisphaerales bacterium]